MSENKLLNEIEKIIKEYITEDEFNNPEGFTELSEALYDLTETTANDYYNQMKVNKEEFGTPARFNHWAKNIYKK